MLLSCGHACSLVTINWIDFCLCMRNFKLYNCSHIVRLYTKPSYSVYLAAFSHFSIRFRCICNDRILPLHAACCTISFIFTFFCVPWDSSCTHDEVCHCRVFPLTTKSLFDKGRNHLNSHDKTIAMIWNIGINCWTKL